MGDGLASARASRPQQVCPANTIALDLVLGISASTPVTGVAAQVDLARWSHRLVDDLLRASLPRPGNHAQSSHLHVGQLLDAR
eukprot:4412137-Pyramimonas_sp.AAC.1